MGVDSKSSVALFFKKKTGFFCCGNIAASAKGVEKNFHVLYHILTAATYSHKSRWAFFDGHFLHVTDRNTSQVILKLFCLILKDSALALNQFRPDKTA